MDYSPIKSISLKLYYLGLIVMICALPLGNFLISLGGIIMMSTCLLHADFKNKFRLFFSNKIALAVTSLFFLYIIGSFYTTDANKALDEIRIVLPLLFLPFVFATMPTIGKKWHDALLHLFVLAVLINSIISAASFVDTPENNYRDIVKFISHIRYSLMLVFSIHILAYYAIKNSWIYRTVAIVIIGWLLYFLNLFESATGFIVLIGSLSLGFAIWAYRSSSKKLRWVLGTSVLVLLISVTSFLTKTYNAYFEAEIIDVTTLDTSTVNGEKYVIKKNFGILENGNYTWKYFAPKELKRAWNNVSDIKDYEDDKSGHKIMGTMIRYMTSKGLRKDSLGVSKLTAEDIINIQNGQCNYLTTDQSGITRRLNQVYYEIDRFRIGDDPSNSSTIRRLHFWNAAWSLFKKNPVIGVGTGSVKKSMLKEYEITDAPLKANARKLIHNQFLTMLVQFGIMGLIWFVMVLASPLILKGGQWPYLALIFLCIVSLSMLSEDTLNTQVGLSFFAFFFGFFFIKKSIFSETS